MHDYHELVERTLIEHFNYYYGHQATSSSRPELKEAAEHEAQKKAFDRELALSDKLLQPFGKQVYWDQKRQTWAIGVIKHDA